MKPLRVLMLSDVYFPRVNGVSTSIETFRRCLLTHAVETTVIAPRYGSEPDEDGIVRIPGRPVPRDPEDRIVSWRALRIAAQRLAPAHDLVHVQTPFLAHYAGVAAARKQGLPSVLTYHTLFEEYLQHYIPFAPGRGLRALARRVSRSQCEAVDAVIVPSSAMRDRLADYGVRSPMQVLPTGIPLARFDQRDDGAFRKRHDLPLFAPLGLFVGRVAHEKNIGFLLQVTRHLMRSHPDFILLIAGEGPARESLSREAKAAGIASNVRFIGYIDREHELPHCYAAADVFMFSSRTETQGLVLIEAMACGLPVVALAEMGTRDILNSNRGALTPAAEIETFAQAVASLIDNPERRRQLSAEAREYSLEWSDAAMAARLADLYRACLPR